MRPPMVEEEEEEDDDDKERRRRRAAHIPRAHRNAALMNFEQASLNTGLKVYRKKVVIPFL